jgi:hypothetical protein
MAKWLEFVEIEPPPSAKTRVWSVRAKQDGSELGRVAWYSAWRKYCFYPRDALFEEQCLRDIASFCERQTQEHKQKLSLERDVAARG